MLSAVNLLFEQLAKGRLREILAAPYAPLHSLVDVEALGTLGITGGPDLVS